MNVSDLIKRHEGLRLVPYKDTRGFWTVGWGHKWIDADGPMPKDGISLEQAQKFFDADFQSAVAGARAYLPDFDSLDEVRQAVLIDMCFNLGATGLAKFKATKAAIMARDWNKTAECMRNSLWYVQVGKRAEELAQMMISGEWSSKG